MLAEARAPAQPPRWRKPRARAALCHRPALATASLSETPTPDLAALPGVSDSGDGGASVAVLRQALAELRSRGEEPTHPDTVENAWWGIHTPAIVPMYGPDAWVRHRSTERYARHALSSFSSTVLRSLAVPTFGSALFTACLEAYDHAAASHGWILLPEGTGLGPLGLTSSALSLLLVFRTNSSYQRFVEARSAWGCLVNRSRDLVREAATFGSAPCVRASSDAVVRWTVAHAQSARKHMRDPAGLRAALARVPAACRLPEAEISALCAADHRPNYCQLMLGALVAAAVPDTVAALRVNEDVRALSDAVGTLERLYRTPIPPSYTRNTGRLLALWWLFTPLALQSELGLWAILVAPAATLVLGAIDTIGVELEEPGAILPTALICDGIAAQAVEVALYAAKARELAAATVEQGR